jgi:hypothetical protein
MKRAMAILLVALPLNLIAADFWPIWIEFPVEKQVQIDGEWQVVGFGKMYFSPNSMSIRFDGLRETRFGPDDDGNGYLEIDNDTFDLDDIQIQQDFEYTFGAATRDRFSDPVAGRILFDAVPIFEGAGYAGSVARFLMIVQVPVSSTPIRYVAPVSPDALDSATASRSSGWILVVST